MQARMQVVCHAPCKKLTTKINNSDMMEVMDIFILNSTRTRERPLLGGVEGTFCYFMDFFYNNK